MNIVFNLHSGTFGGFCEDRWRSTSLNRFFKTSVLVISIIFARQVPQLNECSYGAEAYQEKQEVMDRTMCELL